MKKAVVCLWCMIVIAGLAVSCGGDGEKKPAEEAKTPKLSLRTQEGMMAKLDELGVTIPDYFVFDKVDDDASEYKIFFRFQDIEGLVEKVEAYVENTVEAMKAEGWNQRDYQTVMGEATWLYKKVNPQSTRNINLVIGYYLGGESLLGNEVKDFSIFFKYSKM
ncbi:MAG TPA: hypothetical protein ENN03_10400 [bacterium]|nr:hypothetical protein [bacterium]